MLVSAVIRNISEGTKLLTLNTELILLEVFHCPLLSMALMTQVMGVSRFSYTVFNNGGRTGCSCIFICKPVAFNIMGRDYDAAIYQQVIADLNWSTQMLLQLWIR